MHRQELTIGGQTLSFETGKLAKQADGAVVVRYGDTMVIVTACHAASPREGIDFLPLTVDYREYTYASGRIPGGFFKREGKPAEKEVLTSRLIDRPIRPLFPSGWRYETQVIALVLSADDKNDSDVLAVTGAGAALALSEIPFQKTTAGVRVGLLDGKYIVNPTFEQRRASRLDLIVAGTADAITMVEAGAKEVTEEEMVGALEAAHNAIREIVKTIDALAKANNKKKLTVSKREIGHEFYREVEAKVIGPLTEAMRLRDKLENYGRVDEVLAELRRVASRRRAAAEGRRQGDLQGAEGESAAGRNPGAPPAPRRPQVRRDPRDHHRRRRAPARPWLVGVHARRNAGARHRDARHCRRSAEDRDGRRRDRTSASCCTTTSRRSRSVKCRSCAARAAAKSATARSPSARSCR